MPCCNCNINAYFVVSNPQYFIKRLTSVINFSIQNRFSMFGALLRKSRLGTIIKKFNFTLY
jgi:hypothetical protein